MKKFSEKIVERKNYDSFSMLSSEIEQYTKKMSKQLPREVQDVLYTLDKYNIVDREDIDLIKAGRKSEMDRISKQYNISTDVLEWLKKALRDLKTKIKFLPQYQTKTEREAFIAGKLAMDDLTMDLESEKGRTAVAKQYAPLVYKVVAQFHGKSPLDKAELTSAGLEGLTYAMNTYRKEEKDPELDAEGQKAKGLSFKQYAAWCIRNKILNEINDNSRTVKISQYYYDKAKANDEELPSNISLDFTPDGEEFNVDYFAELQTSPGAGRRDELKEWDKIVKILGDKFAARDVQMFLKTFGLGNHKQMKGNQIAKEFKVTPAMVTYTVKKIIEFLKSTKATKEILGTILQMYSESLVAQLFQLDKEMIKESLLNDDIYLLLEELTRWNNKNVFMNAVNNVCDKFSVAEARFIYDVLTKGFEYLDSNYKKNKSLIIWFLSELYPAENMAKKTDVNLLELMNELIEVNNKHNINWK